MDSSRSSLSSLHLKCSFLLPSEDFEEILRIPQVPHFILFTLNPYSSFLLKNFRILEGSSNFSFFTDALISVVPYSSFLLRIFRKSRGFLPFLTFLSLPWILIPPSLWEFWGNFEDSSSFSLSSLYLFLFLLFKWQITWYEGGSREACSPLRNAILQYWLFFQISSGGRRNKDLR